MAPIKGILAATALPSFKTARDVVIVSSTTLLVPPIGSDGTGFELLPAETDCLAFDGTEMCGLFLR